MKFEQRQRAFDQKFGRRLARHTNFEPVSSRFS
jgi:hypothetical protein